MGVIADLDQPCQEKRSPQSWRGPDRGGSSDFWCTVVSVVRSADPLAVVEEERRCGSPRGTRAQVISHQADHGPLKRATMDTSTEVD